MARSSTWPSAYTLFNHASTIDQCCGAAADFNQSSSDDHPAQVGGTQQPKRIRSEDAQEQAAERSSIVISGHEWDAATAPSRRSSLAALPQVTPPAGDAASAMSEPTKSLRRSQTMRSVLRGNPMSDVL